MHTLPFEIVAQIFSICVRENDISPELLASISRHLREIALHVPELWNNVFYEDERDEARMHLYLERGSTAPLDIQILVSFGGKIEMQQVDFLVQSLTPHAERVRSLRLTSFEGHKKTGWRWMEGPDSLLLNAFLPLICVPVYTHLETLKVDIVSFATDPIDLFWNHLRNYLSFGIWRLFSPFLAFLDFLPTRMPHILEIIPSCSIILRLSNCAHMPCQYCRTYIVRF